MVDWIDENHPARYRFEFVGLWKAEIPLNPNEMRANYHWLNRNRLVGQLFAFISYARVNKPEIALASGVICSLVSIASKLLCGYPKIVIARHHDIASLTLGAEPSWKARRLLPLLMRVFYTHADLILAVSHAAKEDLINLVGHFKKHQVLYNPSISNLPSLQLRSTSDIPSLGPINLLTIAALEHSKDIPTLLTAVALLKKRGVDIILTIAGVGKLEGDLRELVDNLAIKTQVNFVGFVDNVEMLFFQTNIFVLPSQREAFGNVIVESLAFGCPVVATDCPGGPSEIINSEAYGVIVPVGNPELLANAIVEVHGKNYDSEALRRRALDFSAANVTPQLLSYLDHVCRPQDRTRH